MVGSGAIVGELPTSSALLWVMGGSVLMREEARALDSLVLYRRRKRILLTLPSRRRDHDTFGKDSWCRIENNILKSHLRFLLKNEK